MRPTAVTAANYLKLRILAARLELDRIGSFGKPERKAA
jgi:hypothetical protein